MRRFIFQSRSVIAQSITPSRIFFNKTTANAFGRAKNARAAGIRYRRWDETSGRVNRRVQKLVSKPLPTLLVLFRAGLECRSKSKRKN